MTVRLYLLAEKEKALSAIPTNVLNKVTELSFVFSEPMAPHFKDEGFNFQGLSQLPGVFAKDISEPPHDFE